MWPFNKKHKVSAAVAPQQISFSQVDITDGFGDNLLLGPDQWVDTVPLNVSVPDPARVVTWPVAITILRTAVNSSANRFVPSDQIPVGVLNRAAAPVPSSVAGFPAEPANTLT